MVKKEPGGRIFSILGMVFAFLSFIAFPIVLGPAAVIFGVIAVLKDDVKLGILAIVLGVVLSFLSFIFGLEWFDYCC